MMADSTYADESWRVIPDYPDYAVSDCGRVKRLTVSKSDNPRYAAGMFLKPTRTKRRYWVVGLYARGCCVQLLLHRLVCQTFNGPSPSDRPQVAHNDGNPNNNRVDNLRWASSTENNHDKWKHGTMYGGDKHYSRTDPQRLARGTRNGLAKINDEIARSIFRSTGIAREIAVAHGVSPSLVGAIKQGRLWAHATKC